METGISASFTIADLSSVRHEISPHHSVLVINMECEHAEAVLVKVHIYHKIFLSKYIPVLMNPNMPEYIFLLFY